MTRLILLFATLALVSCVARKDATLPASEPIGEVITVVEGDFNGDGVDDDATLYYVEAELDTLGRVVTPESYVVAFAADSITRKVSTRRVDELVAIDDVDADGRDEIALYSTYSEGSSWGDLTVYALKGEEWGRIVTTSLNLDLVTKIDSTLGSLSLIRPDSVDNEHVILRRPVIVDGTLVEVVEERLAI